MGAGRPESYFDTIVAPITGPGNAAVAIVRLSGPDSWSIASKVFHPWKPEPMRAAYGKYRHGDDGLALPFWEGHSYTGEQAVELSIHGSAASIRQLVDACIDTGARLAEPGEFTQRAFLNGRIDLTQAEAVRDTIEARTESQLRLANLQREGLLRRHVIAISARTGGVLAAIEASVDFSEEIGELDRESAAGALGSAAGDIDLLLETAIYNRIIRRGLRVAIVGPPNAGKSSLLNAILGSERAIVTELPGTTRDFVEEEIEVGGLPVVLIDTAGLREAEDRIESLGIQRSRTIAAEADHVWYVFDASVGWSEDDEAFVRELSLPESMSPTKPPEPAISRVANKSDLCQGPVGIPVSAATGEGLPELLATLPIGLDIAHREIAINSRHAELLTEARAAIDKAATTLGSERPTDLASVFLQEAMYALGQITGETASADILSRIFSDFCIGK